MLVLNFPGIVNRASNPAKQIPTDLRQCRLRFSVDKYKTQLEFFGSLGE